MFIPPTALIEDLRRAHHLVVLTGAGISAESGLLTFRQAQTGLWSKFKPEDGEVLPALVRAVWPDENW